MVDKKTKQITKLQNSDLENIVGGAAGGTSGVIGGGSKKTVDLRKIQGSLVNMAAALGQATGPIISATKSHTASPKSAKTFAPLAIAFAKQNPANIKEATRILGILGYSEKQARSLGLPKAPSSGKKGFGIG